MFSRGHFGWALGTAVVLSACSTAGGGGSSGSSSGGHSGASTGASSAAATSSAGGSSSGGRSTSGGTTGHGAGSAGSGVSSSNGSTSSGGTSSAASGSTGTGGATSSGSSSGGGSTSGINGDWPTYLHDVAHTSNNPAEATLSPANAANLTQKWTFTTGDLIEASATVANGVAYVGSWDGNEYALDATSGTLLWQTFLDTTTLQAGCNSPWPDTQGISSTATVQDGDLYVGGGADYWYALSAGDGGVLYRVFTGDSSQAGGYYNWASPLLAGGSAYLGIASGGNCPSVQGAVLQVDLATEAVTNTFDVVPNGQQGGAIWSSPAYDAATQKVFVSTGSVENVSQDSDQPYAQAIVALDAASLAYVDSWQIPQSQDTGDSDFGASPTLFTDAAGDALIGCAGKNGYFYALDRNDLSAGPVWEIQLSVGGGNPPGGQGSISSAAFDGTTIYVAAGNWTLGGTSVTASISALDPTSGSPLWQQPASGVILGALATANGLLVDAAGDSLEVRATADGSVLFSAQLDTDPNVTLSASPSIANGFIYEGSGTGALYAFGL
jgi:outer membrane protein assembly factor BamB